MSIFNGPPNDDQRHVWSVFKNTINARYVHFYPVTWNNHISMRAAVLVGANEQLVNPPESSRSYSSVWPNGGTYDHSLSMLNSRQAWSARRNDGNQWMTIDLGGPKEVRGVVVQGRARDCCAIQFVTTFKIGYSNDGHNFTMLNDTAPTDVNTKAVPLTRGIRFIKITAGTYIQISQLAVYAAGNPNENIAKGKPVSATSIWGNQAPPQNAVDGTLMARNFPAIYHSATSNASEYFLLDLEKTFPIEKIVYYNRLDCCNNRSKGMVVHLQDENRNEVWSGTLTNAMVQTLNFKSVVEDPYRFLAIPERCRGYANKINTGEDFEKNFFKKAIAETCMPFYSEEFVKCKRESKKALDELDLTIRKCSGPLYTCQGAFSITTQMIIKSAVYGTRDKSIDVRQKIEDLRAKGDKSMVVSNVTFGQDPVPGKKKWLRIVLLSSFDAEFRKSFREGETINLTFDTDLDADAAKNAAPKNRSSLTFNTLGKNQNGGDGTQKGGYLAYNEEPELPRGGSVNLLSKLGTYLATPTEANTTDKNPNCKAWADRQPSECELNPTFMLANCARSCLNAGTPLSRDLARVQRARKYNIKHHQDFEEFNKHYKLFSSCPTKDYVKKADVQHVYDKTLALVEKLNALKNNFSTDIRTHPDYRILMDKYALKNPKGDYIPCKPCI